MLAVIISTLSYHEIFLAMQTETADVTHKAHLPIPKHFCKFVRACLDFACDGQMYSSLNTLEIITITGQFTVCSVFYKDIKTKHENYIKAMHIIKTFEKVYKERIEQLLPKIKESWEKRELESTCLDAHANKGLSIDDQWKTMTSFAGFPHYINQLAKYDLVSLWLGSKSKTTSCLIIDMSYRIVLGVFPEKTRNGMIEKLCELERKRKAKDRMNLKEHEQLNLIAHEEYTLNFQELKLWKPVLLLTIEQGENPELTASFSKLEMMKSFFPDEIVAEKLPFSLHVPRPPPTKPKEKEEDGSQAAFDGSAKANNNVSRRSKMTEAVLRKEDQLILESGGILKMNNHSPGSINELLEVSSGTSAVPRNCIKKLEKSTANRLTSIPHVPLENKLIKPDTKASQSSVIDLTPRDIPLIVDTPRQGLV